MTDDDRPIQPGLRRHWLLATVIAFTVGGALAGGVLRFLEEPYYETSVSAIEAARIQALSLGTAEALFGIVLGTAQWLVLRRALGVGGWIPATTLSWMFAGALGGFLAGGSVSTIGPDEGPVPPLVAALVGYPLIATVLGGSQWLVLRRAGDGAGWWPVASFGGLIASLGVGLAIVASEPVRTLLGLAWTDFPSAKVWAAIGLVGGVVYGAVTWVVLAGLRRPAAPPSATMVRAG